MDPQIVPSEDPLYAVAARSNDSGLPLRMVLRVGWCGLSIYAEGSAVAHRWLVCDGTSWGARGGGGGGGGPDMPLRAGIGASWSSPSQPGAFVAVSVNGTATASISRVQIEFDDGHIADAAVSDGVFGWFYARRPAPWRSPGRRYVHQILGADPVRVIGLSGDGRELARQELRPMP